MEYTLLDSTRLELSGMVCRAFYRRRRDLKDYCCYCYYGGTAYRMGGNINETYGHDRMMLESESEFAYFAGGSHHHCRSASWQYAI
eukprot:scaffold1353_cov161-Amphora_coffeaeformis.AAC.31